MPAPFAISSMEPTLEVPSTSLVNGDSENAGTSDTHYTFQVELVAGSGPHLSRETANILRLRLRAAAICLFAGFGSFLLWRFISPPTAEIVQRHAFLLVLHIFITAALAVPSVLLCRKCDGMPLKVLRFYELLIFGLPTLFFVYLNVLGNHRAGQLGHLFQPMATWFLLIFTYALFIPNSWRRAAVVVGMFSLAPILVMLYSLFTDVGFSQLVLRDPSYIVEIVLQAALGFFIGVYGTYTINTLWREAFVAKQLGQYHLLRLLGAGGMGEVYLAEHQLLKRPCAIKLIRPSKAADPKALARFEREVRATAKLSHWNTIDVFDYGRTADGTFYYVMEYLPGMNLAELVEQYGPLSPARVVYLLMQACNALEEAHGKGLVHRDIKPGNIFAALRGGIHDVAKLLDFGLVKTAFDTSQTDLTQEGSITGSPLFMSPEQAMGENESDPRGDIYSLGGVAYFLLTGQPPFPGNKPIKVIFAHVNQPVEPPSMLRDEIPDDLEEVVLRCLAKDPDDRYQTAAELRDALAATSVADGWNREKAAEWWCQHGRCQQAEELLATAAS